MSNASAGGSVTRPRRSRLTCAVCGVRLVLAAAGRPKLYCSGRCRVRAFRLRHDPATLHGALGVERIRS
ncbi:MAG: hypothetical protein JWM84_3150 [Nocardioides sp.]|nr:hypothetical protein [Nocardioides sp.]